MKQGKQTGFPQLTSKIGQYAIVLLAVALVAFLCLPLATPQGYHIVSFILLFAVSLMAAFLGIGPILLASTLSALVWNFFFIPPHHTFNITATEDKFMFGSFFVVALVNGVLTNRIRKQEKKVREREYLTSALFQLTEALSKARGIDRVTEMAHDDFKKHFNAESCFILQTGNNKTDTHILSQNLSGLKNVDGNIVNWVRTNLRKAGKFTDIHPDSDLSYYPLTGTRLNPGVIVFNIEKSVFEKKEDFWQAYFTQISNALEREFLGELALNARILDESDRLYKTLFNLISHEFRIPIATIMGASDTLLSSHTSEENKEELFNEIFKASGRLNHLIENLLNMSRVESGKISVRTDWCDINDLLNKVTRTLKKELGNFRFIAHVSSEMPLVKLDFGLMEQVLYNLILNCCQNSPDGSAILFGAGYSEGQLVITVEDGGPGFPPEMLGRVFEKFFRVNSSRTGGLGLGLSIVKGLVEAHKGKVKVENLKTGGAKFTIAIPSEIPDMKELKLE